MQINSINSNIKTENIKNNTEKKTIPTENKVTILKESFVITNKDSLNKGKVANINVLPQEKSVKIDSKSYKGADKFNAGMLGAMFFSGGSILTTVALAKAPISPNAKLALSAGVGLTGGVLAAKAFLKNDASKNLEKKDNSNSESKKLSPTAEKALVSGFGGFIGGAFGFFSSIGLAGTGALNPGKAMTIGIAAGVIGGGVLGYMSTKD